VTTPFYGTIILFFFTRNINTLRVNLHSVHGFFCALFGAVKFVFESAFSIWSGTPVASGWQFPSQEGQRVGWEYPQVEQNREAPRGGGGWFWENTVVISDGGFSWEFSRPLINHGKHGRKRQKRHKNTHP